ncbi:hypothetical protein FB192DRAFT_1446238 [Mucor lusitanicus]|uniref:Uncharacterized protein n=1 Tax=Mucor circinelloides f. lusitanicus TaxID=29924 RepID=A0A8H4BLP2_MUCCL|nr:hypothetical protein FB192DRAFT_1446238 [Mucor lusitanicus]
MDGIGTALDDDVSRIVIESSGIKDGPHTEEDTLKLLETTTICLNDEKAKYQQASFTTFRARRIFCIQVVGYKLTLLFSFVHQNDRWACLWERSALVPNNWDQRTFWFQTFELLAHLMTMLDDQDVITEKLIEENNGYIQVDKNDTLRFHCRKQAL